MKPATTPDSTSTNANPFVAMTEIQMESVKGGSTAWPDWFVTLIDNTVDNTQDAIDFLDDFIQTVPGEFDSGFWEETEGELDDGGFISDPGV